MKADHKRQEDEAERRPKPNISECLRKEIGHERGDADQHGESVVIDVARLQFHDTTGDIDDAGRDAVGTEPVDDRPSPPFQNRRPIQSRGYR